MTTTMTTTKHTSVDLYETNADDLILVIDEADACFLSVPEGASFRDDGTAILAGTWHPNEIEGQQPVPDDEWERDYASQHPIATLTNEKLIVHHGGCSSATEYLGADAIDE